MPQTNGINPPLRAVDGAGPVATVLTPTPRLTVTIERASDGSDDIHVHAGGQGVWQSRMLALLGLEVRLVCPLAGEVGPLIERLMSDRGVSVHFARGGGSNGAYVHDRRDGERRQVAEMSATRLGRHQMDDLYGSLLVNALGSDVCVLGGPDEPDIVPASLYGRLARDLRANGTPVVIDLTGDPLGAALDQGVTLMKLSDEELGAVGEPPESVALAAQALARDRADSIVVTSATGPTVALVGGAWWTVEGPHLTPCDERGAGDSFTAACAAGIARRQGPELLLATASAAGSLNVTRHGLASGERDRIEQLAQTIQVRPLRVAAAGLARR